MRFAEIDLLGIYVAPVAPLMLAAWLIAAVARRMAERWDLLQHVWHPALLMTAFYALILAALILFTAGASA